MPTDWSIWLESFTLFCVAYKLGHMQAKIDRLMMDVKLLQKEK